MEVYAREATTPAAIFNARGEFAFETGGEGSSEDWAETFNGHTDTRKNGPTAVAFDLTFPSASDAYGLPERATSLSLKSTRTYESGKGWFGRASVDSSVNETTLGEPYRLYNLDVFEYLDDSAFGLVRIDSDAHRARGRATANRRRLALTFTTRARCTWMSTSTALTACTRSGWRRAARWMFSFSPAIPPRMC